MDSMFQITTLLLRSCHTRVAKLVVPAVHALEELDRHLALNFDTGVVALVKSSAVHIDNVLRDDATGRKGGESELNRRLIASRKREVPNKFKFEDVVNIVVEVWSDKTVADGVGLDA